MAATAVAVGRAAKHNRVTYFFPAAGLAPAAGFAPAAGLAAAAPAAGLAPAAGAAAPAAGAAAPSAPSAPSSALAAFFFFFIASLSTRTLGSPSTLSPSFQRSDSLSFKTRSALVSTFLFEIAPAFTRRL